MNGLTDSNAYECTVKNADVCSKMVGWSCKLTLTPCMWRRPCVSFFCYRRSNWMTKDIPLRRMDQNLSQDCNYNVKEKIQLDVDVLGITFWLNKILWELVLPSTRNFLVDLSYVFVELSPTCRVANELHSKSWMELIIDDGDTRNANVKLRSNVHI